MKRELSRVVVAVAALSISIALGSGCTVANACDCADPNVLVRVPSQFVQPTNTVTVSGAGCLGSTVTCTQSSGNGCLTFTVVPVGAGNCHIDVTLPTHTFTTDIAIKRATGCCTGLYPDPIAAGDVQVTSLR